MNGQSGWLEQCRMLSLAVNEMWDRGSMTNGLKNNVKICNSMEFYCTETKKHLALKNQQWTEKLGVP